MSGAQRQTVKKMWLAKLGHEDTVMFCLFPDKPDVINVWANVYDVDTSGMNPDYIGLPEEPPIARSMKLGGVKEVNVLIEEAKMTSEERNFRWAYRLLIALAKRCLADANRDRDHPSDWPVGQDWSELGATSRSVFLRKAREEAGISHDEFLGPIRDGTYDIDDIYDDVIPVEVEINLANHDRNPDKTS